MEPSAAATAGGVHGFPAPLTSFVGRVAAVGENDVKVLIRPRDERMRELISLRAFGLSELDAVRYYAALKMAEHGLLTAPNMAVGEPFNVGLTAAAVTGAGSAALPGVPADGGGIAGMPGGTAVVRAAEHHQGISGVAGP